MLCYSSTILYVLEFRHDAGHKTAARSKLHTISKSTLIEETNHSIDAGSRNKTILLRGVKYDSALPNCPNMGNMPEFVKNSKNTNRWNTDSQVSCPAVKIHPC
jgi:hypothetical protein